MTRHIFVRRAHRVVGALTFAVCVLSPQAGWCQDTGSFSALATLLHPDDRVVVTADGERSLTGRVVSLSDTTLRVRTEGTVRDFAAAHTARVERITPDGLWNGTLWGLLGGVGASFLVLPLFSDHLKLDDADTALAVSLYVVPAIGAATGAAIDASRAARVPVYVRPRLAVTIGVTPTERTRSVSFGARLAF